MIRYDGISLSFGSDKLFNDFSLEIKKGEKVVLAGKSGIGKSSLLYLILGFLRPRNGRVLFEGKPVNEHTIWDIRRKIAFIDQDMSIGDHTVLEWFDFVGNLKANQAMDFSRETIKKLMDLFELGSGLLGKNISDLSGGERQRVAIIVCALLKRDVFLLDEATSALDRSLKARVVDFFTAQNRWTVLSISHDTEWLDNPSVKIYNMEARSWK